MKNSQRDDFMEEETFKLNLIGSMGLGIQAEGMP